MQCTRAGNHWDAVRAELIILHAEKVMGSGAESQCANILARQD